LSKQRNNTRQRSASGAKTYGMWKMHQNRWLRLAIFLTSLTAISFGFAYALQGLLAHFQWDNNNRGRKNVKKPKQSKVKKQKEVKAKK